MAQRDADKIANAYRLFQVRVFRVIEGLHPDVRRRLAGLRTELVTIAAGNDPTEPTRQGDKLNRVTAASKEAKAAIGKTYRGIADAHDANLLATAETQEAFGGALMTSRAPDYAVQAIGTAKLKRIVERAIIEGAPSRVWWSRQAAGLAAKFTDSIREGMQAGESIGSLISRVRGTAEKQYADGIMSATVAQAEALVRSSVLSVQHDTRMAEFLANKDIIRGWAVLTTFDTRTCPICAAISGAAYDLKGKPLPGSPWPYPLPSDGLPIHWSCRCIAVPILEGEPIPTDISYEDWFKAQDAETQLEILGPKWFALWEGGKLKRLRDRIDQKGRPLTLAAFSGKPSAPKAAKATPSIKPKPTPQAKPTPTPKPPADVPTTPLPTPSGPYVEPRPVDPSKTAVPSEPGFVYHGTNLGRATDIADTGLRPHKPWDFTDQEAWPDGSEKRRSYFTATADTTKHFLPEEGRPVLLRVSRDALPDLTSEKGTGDLFVYKRVKPGAIEYLDETGWRPLGSLLATEPAGTAPLAAPLATSALTAAEQEAARSYVAAFGGTATEVQGGFQSIINEKLATGAALTPDEAALVRDLDAFIAKSPRAEVDGPVFRGVRFTQEQMDALAKGETVTFDGFSSASTEQRVAEHLAVQDPDRFAALYVIENPSVGVKLADVPTRFAHEQEVLFPRGTSFRILGAPEPHDFPIQTPAGLDTLGGLLVRVEAIPPGAAADASAAPLGLDVPAGAFAQAFNLGSFAEAFSIPSIAKQVATVLKIEETDAAVAKLTGIFGDALSYVTGPLGDFHARELSLLPEHVLRFGATRGVKVKLSDQSVTWWPEQASSRGIQPRGWPAGSTWDTVPGMHDRGLKTVYAGGTGVPGERGHGSTSLVGHEFGHAVDMQMPAALRTRWNEAHARGSQGGAGTQWSVDYFRQANGAGQSESFAEAFSDVLLFPAADARRRWGDDAVDVMLQIIEELKNV